MSHTPPEPCPRNPRIHRQSGIPSISRPRGTPSPDSNPSHSPYPIDNTATPKISANNNNSSNHKTISGKKSKVVGFQFLSKARGGHDHVSDELAPSSSSHPSSTPSSSRNRRITSMPPDLPSSIQAQIDIDNDRIARGLASPPIVDFTRFEDMYRSPRNGAFEGLLTHRAPKARAGGGGRMAVVKNRSSSTGVKPSLKTETPLTSTLHGRGSTTTQLSVPGSGLAPPSHPACERKPDPLLLLSAIVDILGPERRVEEYLDMHQLLGAHQLDQLDFEERDAVHRGFIESGRLKVKGRKGALVVLGEPIRRASLYSSTTMVLGGRDHILPILVVNCVEELYRTGIYQPQLFRTLPNRARLLELIGIFDSEHPVPGSIIRSRQPVGAHTIMIPNAGFGTNTSLHLESTPDICALVTTYLSSLTEPVLPPFLFRAIWEWCALDDDEDNEEDEGEGGSNIDHNQENTKHPSHPPLLQSSSFSRRQGLPSPLPLSRTYTSPAESTHILLAQLLLHLMPSPNFSLLIYLLAFFSQVALVREENGVGVEDLARMFGGRIFGGGSISSSTSSSSFSASTSAQAPGSEDIFNTTQTRREGETMMSWFLRRWGPISEGLFDVVDDARMGLFRRTLARKDSLGKDVLSGWLSGGQERAGDDEVGAAEEGEGEVEKRVDGGTVFGVQEGDSAGDGGGAATSGARTPVPIPRIRLDMAPQGHSTPKSKTTDSWMRAVRSRQQHEEPEHEEVDIVDDYVLLSSSCATTPTPAVRSNPLEMDDTLDIARMPSTSNVVVGGAISPGDERLMDISMPAFLNQTLPGLNVNANHHAEYKMDRRARPTSPSTIRGRIFCSHGVQTKPTTLSGHDHDHAQQQQQQQREQLAQALESVSRLERELRNCTGLVSDTMKELDGCRRESYQRACRIVELEKALQLRETEGGGDVGVQSKGKGKERERKWREGEGEGDGIEKRGDGVDVKERREDFRDGGARIERN